jgi:hypothetical protein
MTQLEPHSFPLSGLQDLEPEWQEAVIEIITKPPANQILRLSSYTLSMTEVIPISSVEKPPIPVAI